MSVYYDDRWKEAENYLIHEGPSWRHKARLLRNLITNYVHSHSNKSILDVACGSAAFLKSFANIYGQLSGVDHSETALDMAKKNLPEGVFYKLDIESDRIPKLFDTITCMNALEEMKDDYSALKNMSCMLKPDGLLFLVVPHSMKYWTKKDVYGNNKRRYSIEEIIEKCSSVGLSKKIVFTWGYPLYSLYYPLMVKINQENIVKEEKIGALAKLAKKILYYIFFMDSLFVFQKKGRVLLGVFCKNS